MKRIKRFCLPVVGFALGNTAEETDKMGKKITKSMISSYNCSLTVYVVYISVIVKALL